MHPYKHYASNVVEAVIDETGNNHTAEESTANRWKQAFGRNMEQIEGALRSIWMAIDERPFPLLSADSLLSAIRIHGPGWLTLVTQMLIKAGIGPPTYFAFCP